MGLFDSLRNALGHRGADPDEAPAATEAAVAADSTYTVQSGDTLWRIARTHYGDGELYVKVFEANRDVLDDPERIVPGQEIRLPAISA